MTINDIKKNAMAITATLHDDLEGATKNYINKCIMRFFSGDFGEIDHNDNALNYESLDFGEGRIVAKYDKKYNLRDNIYIIAYFSESNKNDVNCNNTVIHYAFEY